MANKGLADILRKSLQEASPHTRGVFGGANAMSPEEVASFLDQQRTALVSTVSPWGAPHITGVGIVFLDGTLYFGLSQGTALHSHLGRNPRVALGVIEPPWKCHVLVYGRVHLLQEGSQEAAKVRGAELAKHGWESQVIARVEPSKIFTWKD